MTIAVNWVTGVITIPKSDLTLVSGSLYELDTEWLREQFQAAEESVDGIPYQRIHDHNTTYTIAGVTYARKIEVLAPYSIRFDDSGGAFSVKLVGSNNNVWDIESGILVQNLVQVIPTNSGGLITTTITTGSGLDAGQDAKLSRIHSLLDVIEGTLDHAEVMRILLAAAAGKASGAKTSTISFRDQADTKDRIVGTIDGDGNRTAVSVDVS